MSKYPDAVDPSKVGEYSAVAGAGGGYVWDEVLEYRVWCHPKDGSDDYYYAYSSHAEACEAFDRITTTDPTVAKVESPLVLVLQREHINELEPGKYVHVTAERHTEWPPEFLSRPKRTAHTIPDFLASDAPHNKLEIIRGLEPNPRHAKT